MNHILTYIYIHLFVAQVQTVAGPSQNCQKGIAESREQSAKRVRMGCGEGVHPVPTSHPSGVFLFCLTSHQTALDTAGVRECMGCVACSDRTK